VLKQLIETSAVKLPWLENFKPNNFAFRRFMWFTIGKFLFYGHIITHAGYKFGYILQKHIHSQKNFTQNITGKYFHKCTDKKRSVDEFLTPFGVLIK
jgi:hypothetical protein